MTTTLTAAETSSRLSPRQWGILLVVILADVLDLMDTSITNIAAPTIVNEIGGGESLVKWLGAAYAVALGVLLVVGGRLGDRYGRRRIFLIGIAGFTVASLACGLALDPTMLVAARLVQGGFGALLIPQGISILITSLKREQLPTVFSVFGPALGASAILGPIVAGFIISADIAGLTWRPVFLINLVLGTVGFITAYRVLPRDIGDRDQRIDGIGAGLLGLTMLGIIYGLIQGSTTGWDVVALGSVAVGLVGLLLFALRQKVAANPLIQPSLLRNRGFTSGMLLGLAYFAAVSGFSYVVSLFYQLSLGLSTLQATFGLVPLMLGIMAASFIGRPLIARLGRGLVVIGLVTTLLGAAGIFVTVLALGTVVTPLWLAPSVLVLGLGMGFCFSSIYDVAIGDVEPSEAGSASGSLSAVQQLAAAIGSAVVTSVFFAQSASNGGTQAMAVSVAVVAGIVAIALGLVWLLPKKAQPEHEF